MKNQALQTFNFSSLSAAGSSEQWKSPQQASPFCCQQKRPPKDFDDRGARSAFGCKLRQNHRCGRECSIKINQSSIKSHSLAFSPCNFLQKQLKYSNIIWLLTGTRLQKRSLQGSQRPDPNDQTVSNCHTLLHYVGWFHRLLLKSLWWRKQKSAVTAYHCHLASAVAWNAHFGYLHTLWIDVSWTLIWQSEHEPFYQSQFPQILFNLHLQPNCHCVPSVNSVPRYLETFHLRSIKINWEQLKTNLSNAAISSRILFVGALCCQTELRCAVHPVHGNGSSLCVLNGRWWNHPLPNTRSTPKQSTLKTFKNR